MPIVIWKNGAILIYRAARYVVPIVIAAGGAVGGAVIGFFRGRASKKKPKDKPKDKSPKSGR